MLYEGTDASDTKPRTGPDTKERQAILRKIALATIAAATLVAAPSLAHAFSAANGITFHGVQLINSPSVNGLMDRARVSCVESAGRAVSVVGAPADGQSSTVLTIELPQDDVTH